MPLVVLAVVRLFRAIAETVVLLANVKVLRALPWPYLRRLPRQNGLIALTAACLVLSVLGLLVGLVVPGALPVGALAGVLSIAVSIARTVGRARSRR